MSNQTQTDLDPMEAAAQEAADVMKALSNPARLRLLCALVPHDRTVGELEQILGSSQAYVSGQLKRLREEGIVDCEAIGRERKYRLYDPRVKPILERLYEVFCAED